MGRLSSIGFEQQTMTAGVEVDSTTGTAPTIDTSIFRSGAASVKFNPAAATSFFTRQFAATSATNNVYVRFYAYFTAFPGANNIALAAIRSAAAGNNLTIRMNTAGTIYLNNEQTATQVGSTSSALSLNTWYRIEFSYVYAGGAANAYIDGNNFATGTATTSIATDTIRLGFIDSATGTYYVDDIAINDNTGSFQTGLPGAGQLVYLWPNAAGDNNAFTVQVGGTAGAANNFTRVKEITPDDATTYNGDALSGDIDDFNIDDTPASIGASDTINVVHVGVRYRAIVAAAEAVFKVRVKKASAGTVTSSAAITPNATTWKSNSNAVPNSFPLTLYQDPDSSNWTKATLDTAQVGYTISTTNTNAANISTVWMIVDSTPVAAAAAGNSTLLLMGV